MKEGEGDSSSSTSANPRAGGTNTSSSGQYISGGAWKKDGILTKSGREGDVGELPPEVDITGGENPTYTQTYGVSHGDDDFRGEDVPDELGSPDPEIEVARGCPCEAWQIKKFGLSSGYTLDPRCCPGGGGALPGSVEKPIDNDTCCKKCENGKFSDRCCDDEFGDERCIYDTITDCQLARKRFKNNKCTPVN